MLETKAEHYSIFKELENRVKKSQNILLVSPSPADVDSLASCAYLYEYIVYQKQWGQWNEPRPVGFCAQNLSEFKSKKFFYKDFNSFFDFLPLDMFTDKIQPEIFDLVLMADYGHFRTTGLFPKMFKESCFFIGFDHHDEPADDFPQNGLQITDPRAASTTLLIHELIFPYVNFLYAPSWKPHIRTYLILGILADTGLLDLNNPRTTDEAIETVLKNKIYVPWPEIMEAAKPKLSPARLKIWARAALSVNLWHKGTARLVISKNDLCNWSGSNPIDFTLNKTLLKDAESFLGIMKKLDGVKLAILALEEADGSWKISLRSSCPKEIPASYVAKELGGGGHKDAAAAIWQGDPYETIKKVAEAFTELENSKTVRD